MIGRLAEKSVLRRWQRAVQDVNNVPLTTTRRMRAAAADLRSRLDRVINAADDRLALPRIGATGTQTHDRAERVWRPDPWRFAIRPHGRAEVSSGTQLAPGLKVFHDCTEAQVIARQVRNTGADDLAPFSITFETLEFSGSFLSVAVDLLPEALRGLTRDKLVRIDLHAQAETPVSAYVRLNVQLGPNIRRTTHGVDLTPGRASADFDLADLLTSDREPQAAWVELIVEAPGLNAIRIRDAVLAQRPRAEV